MMNVKIMQELRLVVLNFVVRLCILRNADCWHEMDFWIRNIMIVSIKLSMMSIYIKWLNIYNIIVVNYLPVRCVVNQQGMSVVVLTVPMRVEKKVWML